MDFIISEEMPKRLCLTSDLLRDTVEYVYPEESGAPHEATRNHLRELKLRRQVTTRSGTWSPFIEVEKEDVPWNDRDKPLRGSAMLVDDELCKCSPHWP